MFSASFPSKFSFQNNIKIRRDLLPKVFHSTEERVRAEEGAGAKERKVKRRRREISLTNGVVKVFYLHIW
jgi:hypothetical protein